MQKAELLRVLQFVRRLKEMRPDADKAAVQLAVEQEFNAIKERSVYRLLDAAVRFSEANTGSFSNVVLSLSVLRKYDSSPFVVIVIRPGGADFLLANTTFLKKISHSSHKLRLDNIKGSFLGHDIISDFDGVANCPENFDALFTLHRDVAWDDNLVRLVEATNAIVPSGRRFEPNPDQRETVLAAPAVAAGLIESDGYLKIEKELALKIAQTSGKIVEAAGIDNVNLRGNMIEQLITQAGNLHSLDDLTFDLKGGSSLKVDIKTKLLNRSASPKLYNVDKMLNWLARGQTAFSLLLVGVDAERGLVVSRLVSVFDPVILAATRIQFHWAGRASRGVTQLTGEVRRCFDPEFIPSICISDATALLLRFLEI